MFYSYFIFYELKENHFLDEKGSVIYVDKKIKTQSDFELLKDKMIEQSYQIFKNKVDWINIKNISYLGKTNKKQIEQDEYRMFELIKLKQEKGGDNNE